MEYYNKWCNGVESLAAHNPHSKHPLRQHDGRLRNLVHSGPNYRVEQGLRHNHPHLHAHLRRVSHSPRRLLAVTILTSEFKYSKVVEHFKFLQYIPGLALFNLLYQSSYAVWPRYLPSSSALKTTPRTL
jgi:hypothetical protein